MFQNGFQFSMCKNNSHIDDFIERLFGVPHVTMYGNRSLHCSEQNVAKIKITSAI